LRPCASILPPLTRSRGVNPARRPALRKAAAAGAAGTLLRLLVVVVVVVLLLGQHLQLDVARAQAAVLCLQRSQAAVQLLIQVTRVPISHNALRKGLCGRNCGIAAVSCVALRACMCAWAAAGC